MSGNFEWQVSKSGPPWIVIDWAGNQFSYDTQEDQLAHVERDKRMFNRASTEVMEDFTEAFTKALEDSVIADPGLEQTDLELSGEQAADSGSEAEPAGTRVGGQGNRRSRRRSRRSKHRPQAGR